MATIAYRYFCNVSRDRFSGYQPGDTMLLAWEDEAPVRDPGASLRSQQDSVLHDLFDKFNRDDRPTGRICPSMSIGDVVVFGDSAWACSRDGWDVVSPPTNITTKSWSEAMDDQG